MAADSLGRGRLTAALTGLAGLVTLAVTLAFGQLADVLAAGECWGSDAVLRFEFARTQQDLADIFGAVGSACRPLNTTAMDAANRLDVFAYIPSYTAFTLLAALYIARDHARLRLAAIALAVLAAASDYVETVTLLRLTSPLELAAEADMLRAATAAWVKFAALALHALVLGWACFQTPSRRPILGVLLLAPAIGLAAMAVDFGLSGLLKLGFFLSWTPLMLLALKEALWPRRTQVAPAAEPA